MDLQEEHGQNAWGRMNITRLIIITMLTNVLDNKGFFTEMLNMSGRYEKPQLVYYVG